MEKTSKLTSKKLIVMIAAIFLVCLAAIGVVAYMRGNAKQVATQEDYGYVNTDETKAEPDAGITIDGVLDEKEYQNNNWLYMRNDNGNAVVDIAMTSYYGEKGMYFVYDVTESTPIYVNLNRTSALNSCVELYLALSDVTNMDRSEIFEIDLLPTGDMVFKQRNGKGAFMDVATTDDKMAYLGATTKGGEINTEDCYGYCLEFFIPWDYLDFLGIDTKSVKTDYVFVNTAHITSYNYAGTTETDRYWHSFAKELGGNGWGNVSLYYRFNKDGVIGTVPVKLEEGDHYTIEGRNTVIPGVKTHVEIIPEEGYAINSILVNGEEYIKKVSYNEDGSISLDVRGVKEGLTISASAEAVTEGNKTLSGTVQVHKVGGDSLAGVVASYQGPSGEKPLDIDSNGKFELKDLKQGCYTITVEKEGYEKVTRTICLNRDIDTEIVLEYLMFEVESGNCWQLEEVNNGTINKMGGFGSLITTDSYKKFSVEANFKYYDDVAESLDEQDRLEQRQGIRIKFSNDKYWHIDLLYQKEKYFIQYAKATTDSIFNFRDIYVLSEEEIAKFKSEDGIQLKVVRDGNRAIIYLGGNLIAVEDLDKEYANLTAKVGFESWGPYTDVRSMEYKITTDTGVDVNALYFGYHKAWDVTRQFEGVVSQPKGGNTVWLRFYEKLTDIDMTLNVLDNPKSDKVVPSTNLRFEFDNDKVFLASIGINSGDGTIHLWNQKSTTNAKTKSLYKFTAEEQAQYMTEEGIDFRFVRSGTELLFFIGSEYKTSVDLSEYIKDDTKAIVSIQHHGDQDVPYVMKFTVSEKTDSVTITQKESAGKEYKTEKGTTVSVSAEEGYYIKKLSLNGKDVSEGLTLDGRYIFVAEEANYTMKAALAKCIFETTYGWNLLEQNQGTKDGVTTGLVSLPDGGTTRTNLSFIEKYADIDLTWRIKDHPDSDAESTTAPRTSFEFVFDEVLKGDNKKFTLSVSESNKGVVQIQNLSGLKDKQYTSYYNFDEEDTAKYCTADGIDFRIVRQGTDFILFVDGELKAVIDLSEYIKADTKATVRINHNDDEGVKLEMPYSVTDQVELGRIYFGPHTNWDVTNQFNGSVTQPNGGTGVELKFLEKFESLDLNIKVLDNPNSDEGVPSTNITFKFDNGKDFVIGVGEYEGVINVWNQPSTINERPYGLSLYKFSAEEQAKYNTEEGIDFRVARNGTELICFVGGDCKKSIDLGEFIDADTPAVVSIMHAGDKGVPYVMPFTVVDTLSPIEVTDNTDENFGSLKPLFYHNGTVAVQEDSLNDSSKYLYAVKLDDGEETPLNSNGIATFNVEADSYTVTGAYKKAIFAANENWDLTKQNQGTDADGVTKGVVSVSGNKRDWLYLYESNGGYGDIDFTFTLKDFGGALDSSAFIQFKFKTGESEEKVLQLNLYPWQNQLYLRQNDTDTLSLGDKYIFTRYSAENFADEGVEVRIRREGTKMMFYVDGVFKKSIHLTGYIENETLASVCIMQADDAGQQVSIPYELSFPAKKVIGQEGAKYLSILGDEISMSTGKPVNSDNNTTTSVNQTANIYGNGRGFGIGSDWTKLYWGQSLVTNNLQLLVNNSASDGLLYTTRNNDASKLAGYLRAEQLHDNTDVGIPNGTEPDIIYLYMGTSDYMATTDAAAVAEKYKAALNTITTNYENAEIFCFTVMPYYRPASNGWPPASMITRMNAVNNRIRELASSYENVTLVDIEDIINSTNYTTYYPTITFNCIMPNAAAHDVIAARLQKALESQFKIESQVNLVNETEDEGSLSIESQKESYAFGDKVVIKTETVDSAYYLHSLTVDGQEVQVSSNGTYELTVSRVSHVVESVFRKKIFRDNQNWDLTKQNQGTDADGVTSGVVSVSGNKRDWLYLYEDNSGYGDIDFAFTLKDFGGALDSSAFIQFKFETGESDEKVLQLHFYPYNNQLYLRQNDTDTLSLGNQYIFTKYSTENFADEGVEVRIRREGTKMMFYVDDVFKKSIYLTDHIENETLASVCIMQADDAGQQVSITYELSVPTKKVIGQEGANYLSILGDGISMSAGVPLNEDGTSTADNHSAISVNNATDIYGRDINQGIASDWEKLYWGQSLTANGMDLLVNSSVSKGLLHANPHASTYGYDNSKLKHYVPGYQRVGQLAANQGTLNGTKPDIIYLYMGTEDRKQSNPTGFEAKYKETLDAIVAAYPKAEVFCFTTMAYYDGGGYRGVGYSSGSSAGRMTMVNDAIRKLACQYENVTLVDIADIITINNYTTYFPETVTRVAPNKAAHDVIAARLQKALESQFATVSQ